MSWMAALDYRQGASHRRAGIPCQDFGRLALPDENTVIAAFADGAGSARFSHLGARAAVDAALPWIRDRIADAPGLRGAVSRLSPERLFDGLTNTVQAAIRETANDNRLSLDDLACTLTVVALAPNGVSVAQIGDGIVVARLSHQDYTLLIQPDRGEYANETSFVTDPDAADRLRVRSLEGPVRFVSAATDGLAAVSVDNRAQTPHAPFFSPIDLFTRQSGSALEVHDGIRAFLASDRLSAKVEDDLTLMVCGWRGLDG
ncbi:PP2C family serine/threonine-protein phosphatase [Pacificispira sp.]|uniref:PP2C family serine/threonine-protein phosphatase n=1 Tax=Pacificispira sp. TaxID=2888761 RepID=UPI003BA84664